MDSITDFIEKFRSEFIDADELTILPETVFRELPTWDSLTSMSILLMINETYQVDITVADLKSCVLVEDIFNLIMAKSKTV